MKLISLLILCFHSIREYYLQNNYRIKFSNKLLSTVPTISYPMPGLYQGCSREAKARADTCADKLWFVGRKSRKYPENEFELQKHCKQTTNLIKCVKHFTDM